MCRITPQSYVTLFITGAIMLKQHCHAVARISETNNYFIHYSVV